MRITVLRDPEHVVEEYLELGFLRHLFQWQMLSAGGRCQSELRSASRVIDFRTVDKSRRLSVCEQCIPEVSMSRRPNIPQAKKSLKPALEGVTAIEAAEEILTEAQSAHDKHPKSDNTVDTSFRADLITLGETLRDEFRNSIAELQSLQTDAITAQSEVLRTLTEMIYQSSASQFDPSDLITQAFSGAEERLLARIDSMAANISSGSSSSSQETDNSKTKPSSIGVKLQSATHSVTRSWEQIRSELLQNGDLSESATSTVDPHLAEKLHEVAQLTSDRHFRLPEQDLSIEIPHIVDPESLSEHELREAFRQREAFISSLIARVRRQQESSTGQLSQEQLRTLIVDLPEELAVQVRHTLKQMEDLARMGELELSLERARIARQVNQLEHSKQLIERNARQLGLSLNADGTLTNNANVPGKGTSSRRWLGKLGFGQ